MSEKKIIVPTIGRVVLVRNRPGRCQFGGGQQPEKADVVYVWSDRLINVAGYDHNGHHFSYTSLPLRQPDDEPPQGCAYAEWMVFQTGQAAKTEDVAKTLTDRVEALQEVVQRHLNNNAAHVT